MRSLLLKVLGYVISFLSKDKLVMDQAKNLTNTVDCVLALVTAAVDRMITRLQTIIIKLEDISKSAKEAAPQRKDRTAEIKGVIARIAYLKKKDAFKRAEVIEVLDFAKAELEAAL